MSSPAPAAPDTPIHDSANVVINCRKLENLWDKAAETLSHADRQEIDFNRSDKRTILNDVLKMVNVKKDQCMRGRWKYKNRNGEDVVLRDLVEKMAKWVNKFKEVGDVAVQYDPTHAALPWAGVRLLLQIAVNDAETFGSMAEGLEHVSNLITRYAIFENLYLHVDSAVEDQLADAIVRLYTAILTYLSKASRYYSQSTGGRIVRSVIHTADAGVDSYLRKISEEQVKVDNLARLVDAQFCRDMYNGLEDLSKEVQALHLTLACELSTLNELKSLQESVEAPETDMRRELEKILHTLDEPIVRMADQLSDLHDNFKREERLQIFRWMSTVPYREHHRAISKDILPNSGLWLLEKPEFIEWRKSSVSSILWLHGIPGSGKTKLVSTIIQVFGNITNPSAAPIAYFYCARNEAEKRRAEPEEILRSIVKQLSCSKPELPIREPVAQMYQQRKEDADQDGSEPVKLSVEDSTELIIALLDYNPATIVIDALDECQPNRRYELMNALNDVIKKSANLVKVFVSSRDDIDIVLKLAEVPNIFINASDNRKDIEDFVHHEVGRVIANGRLLHGKVSNELKSRIINTLIDGANGMFRWVSLQIQNLCDSQRMKIEDDIDHELGRLPQTLADLYAVIYKQISQTGFNGRLIAERALKWLLCAQESLSTEKFIAAVSVGSGKYTPLTNENILGLCCNFVVLDTELDTFRFTHLSVREYLEGRPEYAVNEINALAMERCLEVYLYNQRTVHALEPTAEQHNQLCRYATLYWPSHYQNLDEKWRKEYFSIKVEKFLFQGQDVNPSFTKWIQNILQFCELTSRFGPNRDSRYISFKHRLRAVYSSPPTPLFTACIFGFFEILEKLNTIENNNWNQKNSEGYNALHLAIRSGHDAVVKLLLEKGAELESKDTNFGQTPLSLAAENGNDAVVKLLLENGAELESKDALRGQTPLSLAAENGHDAVVKLLLEKDAELESKDTKYSRTPLSWAARYGHDVVVKLLLRKGVELESKDALRGQTPLSLAAGNGHDAVVKLLLEKGAELESKEALRGQTPLSLAARNGRDAVVKLLLEKGAELESKDTEFNRTPLPWAARYGHDAVVKLLLEKGTKLETKDTVYGLTPLSLANRYGHDEVVKLLLEKGAKKP